MSLIFEDRCQALLAKIGLNIKEQRVRVFREDEEAFARRIAQASSTEMTETDIVAMEKGDGTLAFEKWMRTLSVIQVADSVCEASKSDASLFLAAAKHVQGIEEEMRNKTPR